MHTDPSRERPTQALELKGVNYTIDDLYDVVIRDRAFWGRDGGVTVSGGEATLQWQDVLTLFQKLKEAGVHTALDTCGFARPLADAFMT